jgi:hypothetical protein
VPSLTGAGGGDSLRLGTWRSLWAAPKSTSRRAAVHAPQPGVELSPTDAGRLGVNDGAQVEVAPTARACAARRGCAVRCPAAPSSARGHPRPARERPDAAAGGGAPDRGRRGALRRRGRDRHSGGDGTPRRPRARRSTSRPAPAAGARGGSTQEGRDR